MEVDDLMLGISYYVSSSAASFTGLTALLVAIWGFVASATQLAEYFLKKSL